MLLSGRHALYDGQQVGSVSMHHGHLCVILVCYGEQSALIYSITDWHTRIGKYEVKIFFSQETKLEGLNTT